MTIDQAYLADLERALKRSGVEEPRIVQVITEVSNHLTESGDQPVEAFGAPERYAAALVAVDRPEQADSDEDYERRTSRATAKDEIEILAELGRDGWALTGVRDLGLHARRPATLGRRTPWHYERRTEVRRQPVLEEMQAKGWAPCGSWLTFHYFNRARDGGVAAPVAEAGR